MGALTVTKDPTNGTAAVDLSAPYTEAGTLTGAEYWIGTADPGVGNATSAQIALTTDTAGTVKTVSASGISLAGLRGGQYQVNLRVVDSAGNWSTPVAKTFTITPYLARMTVTPATTTGPTGTVTLSAAITAEPQPNNAITGEYWVGRDAGLGRNKTGTFTISGGQARLAGVDASVYPTGTTTFTMRVKDRGGRWSNNISASVSIRQNVIFASTLQNATLGDWSLRTGLVTSSTAAFQRSAPALETPLSTRGLRVAIPAVGGSRASYVTDRNPAAESQYWARFLFNQNSLNSGAAANVLTIFEGRTANAQAFAVQYHRSGTASQVRLVLGRNGTLGASLGPWVNLGTGTKKIELGWSAAPTATGTGSVALRVNGGAASTLSGLNSQFRVESANLGVSAGVVAGVVGVGTTGVAYFDSFTSTRFTAPTRRRS